jgi:hypothetical protein
MLRAAESEADSARPTPFELPRGLLDQCRWRDKAQSDTQNWA